MRSSTSHVFINNFSFSLTSILFVTESFVLQMISKKECTFLSFIFKKPENFKAYY